jgi:transcriptional regulator with XRE-family HTH domain
MAMVKENAVIDPRVVEAKENLLIDYQFLLQERMQQKGISQTELAQRAGISKARLSQILSDEANPTVKTFAELFHVLGERVHVTSVPLGQAFEKADQQEGAAALPEWRWESTASVLEATNSEMVALMKGATVVHSAEASNDNYTGRTRVKYVESEFALLQLEPAA